MPGEYKLSDRAQEEYDDILRFIALDSLIAAYKVRNKFDAIFLQLAQNPNIGHKRDDVTKKPVRFWNLYTYQIVHMLAANR